LLWKALFLYYILALPYFVGVVGKNRNIGFGMTFISALFLSPIIGIVIVLLSKTKKERKPPVN
jgi:hypothetical protein